MLRLDGELADKRAGEGRDNAALLAVAALQKHFSELEEKLTALANLPENDLAAGAAELSRLFPEDSAILLFNAEGVEAYPPGRLVYYPALAPAAGSPPEAFAEFEAASLLGDDSYVIETLKKLSLSENTYVRAEALARLGGAHRQTGRGREAEAVYARLAGLGAVPAAPPGIPAELVARAALLGLLEESNERDRLAHEARALFSELHSGRWRITYGVYDDYYRNRVLPALGAEVPPIPDLNALVLSEAALTLWEQNGKAPSDRRQMLWIGDRPILVVERTASGRMAALAAGPEIIQSRWLADVRRDIEQNGARIVLTDREDRPVLGSVSAAPDKTAVRFGATTGLPWNLYAVSIDGGADAVALRRRQFVIVGVCAIAVLVIGGSCLIGHAVSRESAMARQQSEFVAAVSHEFRAPLTVLRQLSEVFVQDRVASEDVRRQYYTVLDRESGRLHRLVEGLLKFGDPRHDKFGTIDTAALLRSVVEEFSVEADRRGYRIELNAGDASLSVRADREALSCVVWNLLDNAVKYSPGNNTVWVELSRMNGHVAIRVRDEGAGIPRNDQRRIFKKFVRGATARTLGVPGTGIGLAVAHQIVKRHGGDIRLQSEPGKGSTFTVLLPLPPGEGVA